MKTRQEYIDKMAKQLKDWSSRIDEMETKMAVAKEDLKSGYQNNLRDLKKKRDSVQQKLQELRQSSGEAWETLRDGLDKTWIDFTEAVSSAKDKFKKRHNA